MYGVGSVGTCRYCSGESENREELDKVPGKERKGKERQGKVRKGTERREGGDERKLRLEKEGRKDRKASMR